MNRCIIISTFDYEGQLDWYSFYLIDKLKKISSSVAVVHNGMLEKKSMNSLAKYVNSDCIFQRNNTGFDAGAYKEILLELKKNKKLSEYDELIFCNDTIYGPFIPMEDIFSKMDEKDVDFWGIQPWDEGYASFLCSFFLVFRKPILEDAEFYEYFEKHIDEDSTCIADAYGSFEMGLFKFLCDKGYRWDSFSKLSRYHSMKTPDALIKDYNFPFIKRRAFCPEHYHEDNLCAALQLAEEYGYDTRMILENASRRFEISDKIMSGDYTIEHEPGRYEVDYSDVTPDEIIEFIENNNDRDIYVYGAGAFGSRVCVVYREYAKRFKGFAVTKSDGIRRVEENVTSIFEIDTNKSAFIVGLDRKNTKEVMESALKDAPYVLTLYR